MQIVNADAATAAGDVSTQPIALAQGLNTRNRKLFTSYLEAETWGEYAADQYPALFNGDRASAAFGVHALGQDTFDVLTSVLGMGDEEIADLMAAGALS